MKRSSTFTCAAVAAALLTLPASSLAQTPPTGAQPPATAKPQQTATTDTAKTDAAKEHLAKASAALNEIKAETLDAAAKKHVAELKRRINTLERTVAANDKASATGAAQRSERATSGARGAANWGTEVAAIDKTLTTLLGPETPAPTGTSGAAKTAAAVKLDDTTRAKLTDVRTHVTAFATAMAGGEPKKEEDAAQPEPQPSAPASTTPTPASQPAAPPASPTPSTPTQDPAQATAPAQSTAQPDEQAARRHLTEARNTLSAMTQLPAAAQLSGEARTQVSQLISNFNDLISAQSNWKESYDKVAANLTLLLGPDNAPPPTTPPATGTPGAVGTSGTAAVDPTIREKLVELRRQLSEFEKVASGGAASTADPAATSTPPASTPTTSAPPSAAPTTTPPSSTPPSAAPPSGTPETTPAAQAGSQPAAGNAELMRHIAAIETLLKSEDDSGGLTLTKMQMEQLRTHWAALKAAIQK